MFNKPVKAKYGIAGFTITRDTDEVFRGYLFAGRRTRLFEGSIAGFTKAGGIAFLIGAWLGSSGGEPVELGVLLGLVFGIPGAIIGAFKELIRPRSRDGLVEITPKLFRLNGKRYALKDVGPFSADEKAITFEYGRDMKFYHPRQGQNFQSLYDLRALLETRRVKFLSIAAAPARQSSSALEDRTFARSAEF